MEFFLAIFIAFIVIVAAVLLVVFYYLRKGYRFITRVANGDISEEEFERLSKRHYKKADDTINFDADYFKTTNKKQEQKKQQQTASHTFRTADGITITDQRTQNQSKKIFAQDEGEYVDYTES